MSMTFIECFARLLACYLLFLYKNGSGEPDHIGNFITFHPHMAACILVLMAFDTYRHRAEKP